MLEHGIETGIIRQLPSGEFIEVTRPVSEETQAVLESSRAGAPQLARVPAQDADEVPDPASTGILGRTRLALNRVLTEGIPLEADGHGNGHGNGHAAPAAVTAGEQGQGHRELEQGGPEGGDPAPGH
jgi:ubiquinol-cytochrome c reductase cytochrome b subunit